MRSAEAIQKHWCLVFVAYSFLHLDCLPPSPTKGSLPIKTIGAACRQQAQALGIHARRDTLRSIAYSEELISSTISATFQSTDQHHEIVGQERCHFQLDS